MNVLRFFVIGLYYGLAFFTLIVIADFIFPGNTNVGTFSIMTVIAIFFATQADTVLNLGSIENHDGNEVSSK